MQGKSSGVSRVLPFLPSLSSQLTLQVIHGGGNDAVWLQRDFGLFLVNVFDTEKACQVLGYHQRSLGALLQRFCGIQADKSLGQRADWRRRCAGVQAGPVSARKAASRL